MEGVQVESVHNEYDLTEDKGKFNMQGVVSLTGMNLHWQEMAKEAIY